MRYIHLFLIFLLLLSCKGTGQKPLRIAAASDLKSSLDSIAKLFSEKENISTPEISYGSSGKLFEQIRNGAPFDLFFSADESYPQQLKEAGMTENNPELYGVGRIVIWSKKTNPQTDGVRSLMNPMFKKIALANPELAPYGKRAKEFLEKTGLMDSVAHKLVYGESISQAAQFLTAGAADAGIIALSLAKSPLMEKEDGNYFLIADSLHSSLKQSFVIIKSKNPHPKSMALHDFMLSPAALAILDSHGFSRP